MNYDVTLDRGLFSDEQIEYLETDYLPQIRMKYTYDLLNFLVRGYGGKHSAARMGCNVILLCNALNIHPDNLPASIGELAELPVSRLAARLTVSPYLIHEQQRMMQDFFKTK